MLIIALQNKLSKQKKNEAYSANWQCSFFPDSYLQHYHLNFQTPVPNQLRLYELDNTACAWSYDAACSHVRQLLTVLKVCKATTADSRQIVWRFLFERASKLELAKIVSEATVSWPLFIYGRHDCLVEACRCYNNPSRVVLALDPSWKF